MTSFITTSISWNWKWNGLLTYTISSSVGWLFFFYVLCLFVSFPLSFKKTTAVHYRRSYFILPGWSSSCSSSPVKPHLCSSLLAVRSIMVLGKMCSGPSFFSLSFHQSHWYTVTLLLIWLSWTSPELQSCALNLLSCNCFAHSSVSEQTLGARITWALQFGMCGITICITPVLQDLESVARMPHFPLHLLRCSCEHHFCGQIAVCFCSHFVSGLFQNNQDVGIRAHPWVTSSALSSSCTAPSSESCFVLWWGKHCSSRASVWGGKRKRTLHCKAGFLSMTQYFLG